MANKIILLYGKPACGKLTVANELQSRLTPPAPPARTPRTCLVFDNHFFNDIVFPYIEIKPERLNSICKNVYKIRELFFKTLAANNKFKDSVIIFTNVLLDTRPDKKSVREIEKFANKICAEFYPVQLVCDTAEMLNRVGGDDRKLKHKLTDADALKNFIDTTKFMTIKNTITVVNQDLPNTVDAIIAKCNL